jgi:hypothetical protein
MTEYRNIYVKKRSFVVLTKVSHSQETHDVIRGNEIRFARNGDTRVTRNGDTRASHGNVEANLRTISVMKRRFVILAKKLNGS